MCTTLGLTGNNKLISDDNCNSTEIADLEEVDKLVDFFEHLTMPFLKTLLQTFNNCQDEIRGKL